MNGIENLLRYLHKERLGKFAPFSPTWPHNSKNCHFLQIFKKFSPLAMIFFLATVLKGSAKGNLQYEREP
jgi:hypothetical protein